MADKYIKHRDELFSSSRSSVAITPNDAIALTNIPKAIYIGVSGNIVVTLVDDTAPVTFLNVIGGTILPVRPIMVFSTGTTATGLLGLY